MSKSKSLRGYKNVRISNGYPLLCVCKKCLDKKARDSFFLSKFIAISWIKSNKESFLVPSFSHFFLSHVEPTVTLLDTTGETSLDWTRYPYGPQSRTPGVSIILFYSHVAIVQKSGITINVFFPFYSGSKSRLPILNKESIGDHTLFVMWHTIMSTTGCGLLSLRGKMPIECTSK